MRMADVFWFASFDFRLGSFDRHARRATGGAGEGMREARESNENQAAGIISRHTFDTDNNGY